MDLPNGEILPGLELGEPRHVSLAGPLTGLETLNDVELALVRQVALAEQRERALRRITHDLRGGLGILVGGADVMEVSSGITLGERGARALQTVRRQAVILGEKIEAIRALCISGQS